MSERPIIGFDGVDWDEGNRDKCQQHGVTIGAVEQLFGTPVVILPDEENSLGKQRYRAIGVSSERRMIFVVFTLRDHTGSTRIRPISARYMHRKEVRSYEAACPDIQDRQGS
jgi:uncharacterized DUF497 family protein